MNRIIKSHLESFVKSFGLEQEPESSQFEMFVNFSILSEKTGANFELEDVTTGEGEDGMDGVAILIDEDVILSVEDAESVFDGTKRNHEVEVIFIQAKTSDSFDLGDFLKFKESIVRFTKSAEYTSSDDVQRDAKKVFDKCIDNVTKIRGGKPGFIAKYVTTGIYRKPKELELAKESLSNELSEIGYFSGVDISFIDRDQLTSLWVATYSGINAQLDMFSHAPLPKIEGIEEAYLVVVVKAKDFVEKLLLTNDGGLRTQVFEENVRAFLGLDNPVNQSISRTLNAGKAATRFPVLNNGITIVSPDVRVQNNTLHLENYQIINGCQTSSVLFENRNAIDNGVMVNLKVVEVSESSNNEDVFSELVRATNSQSKVDESQFLSLRPIVKKAEQYFNTYDGQDGRLFLERRDKQYVGRDIPGLRTFALPLATKCVAAMFFERPDLTYKNPKKMYELLTERIFAEDNKEIIFYTSCLTLYRLNILVSNSVIPQNTKKHKWHILVLVRAIVSGKAMPKLNSKKIEPYCQKIIDLFSRPGESSARPFQKAVEIIGSIENVTSDRLKRQAILEEMLKNV